MAPAKSVPRGPGSPSRWKTSGLSGRECAETEAIPGADEDGELGGELGGKSGAERDGKSDAKSDGEDEFEAHERGHPPERDHVAHVNMANGKRSALERRGRTRRADQARCNLGEYRGEVNHFLKEFF
ncbi:MAG TPA: hypothetical protein VGV60_05785 [Candidatus Polarisedimenticolia bacterium]|jgi:hypothetical protein|nr:hypothetical protein [Candidatus Polarisedimenticolia bacterium]